MAQAQSARQARIKARSKARQARIKARQERRATRQENKTRRTEARQATRKEKIIQKGQSGFYSPAGIKARGDVGTTLIGQGLEIAGLAMTGGASAAIPSGASSFGSPTSEMDFFGMEQSRRAAAVGINGFGGGGGGALMEEEKPFYTNPLFIGALVGGGILLFTMTRNKDK